MYHYLVGSWGNDAALLENTIPLGVHLVLLSLSGIACQAFFIHR
jgi:hypothetical protein